MSGERKHSRVVYDPLTELMDYYSLRKGEVQQKAPRSGPIEEWLKQRIVDGDKAGMQADLDEALGRYTALDIINTILLEGMKVVGELFGSGQMQLPFVLQSAEVMKSAVAYLEQFMDKAAASSKGTMVIATVKGDVHDIGKNLVDIILTNNGYAVINLGIKCPVETMLHAAEEHKADAIGMSGLLVKSTLIMKENLEVMNERGVMIPVILGGAALTRRYVEEDLRTIYKGTVVYAKDAFDGLRFMDGLAGREETLTGTEAKIALAVRAERRQKVRLPTATPVAGVSRKSNVREMLEPPTPPFWGTKVVEDVPLEEVFAYINEAALIRGQWQVKKGKMGEEAYSTLLEQQVRPELEALKSRIQREHLLQPRVVYGYFPCRSDGDTLLVYDEKGKEVRSSFTFPRQQGDRHLCIADFFAPKSSGRMDVVAFQLVTMGRVAGEHSARLFSSGAYKDYLYFHGLSVESAEALAELWHKRIREELGIAGRDARDIRKLFSQGYQGSRYSFGYPACPSLEDQAKVLDLLDGDRIGVRLTEHFSLDPEQSTNAIVVHHPDARYFSVG